MYMDVRVYILPSFAFLFCCNSIILNKLCLGKKNRSQTTHFLAATLVNDKCAVGNAICMRVFHKNANDSRRHQSEMRFIYCITEQIATSNTSMYNSFFLFIQIYEHVKSKRSGIYVRYANKCKNPIKLSHCSVLFACKIIFCVLFSMYHPGGDEAV